MRKLCLLGYSSMAIVKAKPLKAASNYNFLKIAEIFSFKAIENEAQDDFTKRYFHFLGACNNLQQTVQAERFVKANQQLKILEFTKQSISKSFTQITKQAQVVIDSFFFFLCQVFCEYTIQNKTNLKQTEINQSLIDILAGINQFFPLMTLNKKNCMQFLKTISHAKSFFIKYFQNADFYCNIRIALDNLGNIPINQFSQSELIKIFKNLSYINIHNVHFEKSIELINYFWNGIEPNWIKNQKIRSSLIYSMNIISCFSQSYLKQVEELLFNQQDTSLNLQNRLFLLTTLIKFGQFQNSKLQEKYDKLIHKFLVLFKKQNKLFQLFSKSFLHFYRAGVWNTQYWSQFFEFVKKDKNRYIQYYHLYVISRLLELDKDVIPIEVRKKGQFLKDLVSKNFTKDEMLKDYEEKQTADKGLSCQIQLANSLRLINTGSVRTECLIDFFVVDILVDGKYVIQVNGGTHYIINLESNKKQYNIKTKFRSRLLKKLGYIVIEVDLEDYSESSFSMVEQIYNIVKKGLKEEKDLQLFK